MKKIYITEIIDSIHPWDWDDFTIEQVINDIECKANQHKPLYSNMRFRDGGGFDTQYMEIWGERIETDKELAKREEQIKDDKEQREKQTAKRKKQKELKILERLKKKYGK
ncbi:MAG TPA: hypothetical protein ENI23_04530 [bacterium]|nr:hypothetical protein [bacterium]